jgi:hypothetical protein
MHAMGFVSLHASAVAIDGQAIGFLAAKGGGKSTLAIALAAAGAQLITDDTLPVWPHDPPTVTEGIHGARLNGDSAARLLRRIDYTMPEADGKHRITGLPADRIWTGEAPLAALYVLAGGDANGDMMRRRLPMRAATMMVTRHTKVGALLGRAEAAIVLDRVATIVRSTPVFELFIPRGFDRLGDAVAQLRRWHAGKRAS